MCVFLSVCEKERGGGRGGVEGGHKMIFLLAFVYNSIISPGSAHTNGKASVLCYSSAFITHVRGIKEQFAFMDSLCFSLQCVFIRYHCRHSIGCFSSSLPLLL